MKPDRERPDPHGMRLGDIYSEISNIEIMDFHAKYGNPSGYIFPIDKHARASRKEILAVELDRRERGYKDTSRDTSPVTIGRAQKEIRTYDIDKKGLEDKKSSGDENSPAGDRI